MGCDPRPPRTAAAAPPTVDPGRGQVKVAILGSTGDRLLRLRKNGIVIRGSIAKAVATGADVGLVSPVKVMALSAGDYLDMQGLHAGGGGSRATFASTEYTSALDVAFLRR